MYDEFVNQKKSKGLTNQHLFTNNCVIKRNLTKIIGPLINCPRELIPLLYATRVIDDYIEAHWVLGRMHYVPIRAAIAILGPISIVVLLPRMDKWLGI